MAIDKPKRGVVKGSGAKLTRNKKGVLSSTQGANYAGVSQNTLKQDRIAKAGTGSGSYAGNVAPRVGGTAKKGAGKTVSYGNSSAISKNKVGKLKK